MTAKSYMGRPGEVDKQPKAHRLFEKIAQAGGTAGREDVFWALWSFWNFSQALDDVIDSGQMTDEERIRLLKASLDFVTTALVEGGTDERGAFADEYGRRVQSMPWDDERKRLALEALVEFTGNLVGNDFYGDHAREHVAQFRTMVLRVIKGDELAGSIEPFHQAIAPAVKCADLDFFVHCAFLAGGWELAREISRLMEYDKPD